MYFLFSKTHKITFVGFTPLMYAAQNGDHDWVQVLLEAGASLLCKVRYVPSAEAYEVSYLKV